MTRRIGFVLGTMLLAMLPAAAHAGIVLGASAGQAGVNIDEVDFDESDFSWKAYGGFRFLKFLGLKAEYLDMGTPEGQILGGDASVSPTGWNVLAEGVLPLGKHFELFVTAGYMFWDFESSVSSALSGDDENSGEDFMYGAGAAFIFNDLIGVRVEWQQFDTGEDSSVDFITAGIDFRF